MRLFSPLQRNHPVAATTPLHYTPSGRVGWHAPLKVAVYGGVTSALLALVYAALIRYNPFVYVSFIATAVFGCALGVTATHSAEAGLSRSRTFNLMCSACAWLIARQRLILVVARR